MRWLLRIFSAGVVLCILTCTLFLTTDLGLKLALRACHRVPGLSISSIQGRLGDHFYLQEIRYVNPSSEIRLDKLEIAWKPWQLFAGKLHFLTIAGQGATIVSKENNDSTAEEKQTTNNGNGMPVVPLSFAIDTFHLSTLRFVNQEGEELLSFDEIDLQLRENNGLLEVPKLIVNGPEMGYDLHGSLNLHNDFSVNVLGSWRIKGFGFHPSRGTLSANGPLNTPEIHVKLDYPANISVNGRFAGLLTDPQWTATLDAKDVDLSDWIINCPQIILQQVHGDLYGDFGRYRGRVTADGAWQGLDQLHLVTDIDGDGYGIQFINQEVTRKEGIASGHNASINWRNIFGWEGDFEAENFDISTLDIGIDGLLNGKFSSTGEVLDDGVLVSFLIEDINGTLANQAVSMNGEVLLTEKGVQTENLVLHSGEYDGTATIHWATFDWTPELCWSTDIELDHFSPSVISPLLEGEVSTVVESEGCFHSEGPEGYLRLHTLQGQLNEHELWGGGEVRVSGGKYSSPGLQLQAGPTIIKLKGTAGNELGLDFSLSSSDIGSLLSGAKGSLHGVGTLAGQPKSPTVEVKLDGYNLGYGDVDVGYSGVRFKGTFGHDTQFAGNVTVESLAAGAITVNDAELVVHGSLLSHDISFTSAGDESTMEVQLHGSYDKIWNGSIASMHFADDRFGTWDQSGHAALTISGQGAKISEFCMQEEGDVCLRSEMEFTEAFPWTVAIDANSLPLAWLKRWELAEIPVSGDVAVQVRARGDRSSVTGGHVVAYTEEAVVAIETAEGDPATVKFVNGRLTSQLVGKVLTTGINLSTATGGEFDLGLSLGGVGTFAEYPAIPRTSSINGELRIQDFDVAFLTAVSGYWLQPKGRLYTALKIGGTLLHPRLQGTGFVRDGGLVLPDQGVELDDIQFRLDGRSDVLTIRSRISSGPGEMVVEGELRYLDDDIAVELQLQGENFLIVELPEYVFRVNPALKFSYLKGLAKVEGDVKVVYGLITPEEIKNAVTASTDVVFINDIGEEEKSGFPILLNLRINLGDDVRINGYGVKGNLRGNLQVRTNSSGLITGKGEVDLVNGTFTIYSRSLDIARGRVLFTGGPIDNPGVDIRAQKTVSDEQAKGKGYTVGVDIGGLVQDLQYQLFSDPAMDDTEILSLMVVGHSLANSSSEEGNMLLSAAETLGIGGTAKFVESLGEVFAIDDLHIEGSSQDEDMSLVVGKKITKDLYIGYDVNMFNQVGQFRVRYDLIHGFWVETRSSSEATGADLFYSFKK